MRMVNAGSIVGLALIACHLPLCATVPDLEIYIQQYNVGTGKVEYYAEGLGDAMWDNDFNLTDVDAYWNPMASYDWDLDTTLFTHGWHFISSPGDSGIFAFGVYKITNDYSTDYFYLDFRDSSLKWGIDIVYRYDGSAGLVHARGTNPPESWHTFNSGDTIKVWKLKRGESAQPCTAPFQPTDPSNLTVSNSGGHPLLSWSPSQAPASAKYHVFSRRGDSGPFEQVTSVALASTSYLDERFSSGGSGWTEQYKVRAISADLTKWSVNYTNTVSITVNKPIEKVAVAESWGSSFLLGQNTPNPFNLTTLVRVQLPEENRVRLRVFDVLGREVEVLADESMSAGFHEFQFRARDLPSGVYLYRLEAGEFVATRRLLLLR